MCRSSRWHGSAEAFYCRETRLAPNAYRASLSVAAAGIVESGGVRSRGFTVTPAMREAFWDELVERRVPLRRWVFEGAHSVVDRELGYALARQRWGEAAEIERRAADDAAMRAALALTSRARTMGALVAVAASPLAAR